MAEPLRQLMQPIEPSVGQRADALHPTRQTGSAQNVQRAEARHTPLELPKVWSLACRANLRAGRLPTAALCLRLAEEPLPAESKKSEKGNQHAGGGTTCERDVLLTRRLLLVAREADIDAAAVLRKLLEFESDNLIASGYLRLLEHRNARS